MHVHISLELARHGLTRSRTYRRFMPSCRVMQWLNVRTAPSIWQTLLWACNDAAPLAAVPLLAYMPSLPVATLG